MHSRLVSLFVRICVAILSIDVLTDCGRFQTVSYGSPGWRYEYPANMDIFSCSCGQDEFCRCPGEGRPIYIGSQLPSPTPSYSYLWCPGAPRGRNISTVLMESGPCYYIY